MRNSSQSGTLDRYVAEMNRYSLLTREQEAALAQRYRNHGDLEAARQLMAANLRFVLKVAHTFRGYGVALPDLVQEGNLGLMAAVNKFDPDRGYRLVTYAVWWIRAHIQNYVIRSHSLVKLGTTQDQRKLFFRVRRERDRAERAAGRPVSIAELAERMGVNEKAVASMERRLAARDFSLDVTQDPPHNFRLLDTLADDSPNPEERVAADEHCQVVRGTVARAMDRWDEREQYIVKNRLLTEAPKTLREIGHHFRISRERARQIEAVVLAKIRAVLLASGLDRPLGASVYA